MNFNINKIKQTIKKFSFLFCLIIVVLSSCKKDKTTDDADVPADPFADITVSKTQQSLVMLGTATWCPYCGQWGDPDFYTALKGKTNGDIKNAVDSTRINGIELHPTTSPENPNDPLYTLISKQISDSLGINSIPDLWADFQNAWTSPGSWNQKIKETQARTNPVCSIGMKQLKDNNTFTVYVKVNQISLDSNYRVAVYAVEDNLIAKQNVSGKGYVSNFVHHNVLRAEITNNTYLGAWLLKGKILPQSEYHLTYNYTVPTGQNVDNIKFVGAVYKMYWTRGKWGYWYSPNSCTTR